MGRLLLTLLFIGLSATAFATNGLSPIGYGVKSKGMGGASAALPQDSFVVAVNPAGLVDLDCRVDVELSYTFQDLFYDGNETDATSKRGLWWPGIGAVLRLNGCQSFGLALYMLGANDTHWSVALPNLGAPPFEQDFVDRTLLQNYFVAITPAYSWRIFSTQSLGISANIVVATANGQGLSRLKFGAVNRAFVTRNGVDVATGVSLRLGWLGHFFCNRLSVGASLSTRTYMSRFSKYMSLFGDYGAVQWPWSATIGAAWTLSPCWTIALDYRYIDWKSVGAYRFSNFVNQANQGDMARGMWNGQGFGLSQQSVAKVGVSWTPWSCLDLRLGYNYVGELFPGSEYLTAAALIPQVIKNHITTGFTYRFCFGEISGYYLHGFRRTGRSFSFIFPNNTEDFVNVSNQQNEVGLGWGCSF